tara:strand:+ start:200 stop:508 length:309 start_codon:yes stop_codon:yes gene_type:complete
MILTLTIILLILSLVANIGLLWFCYKSLQQIRTYDNELTETVDIIKNFNSHLKGVYEMEMFYGDETLRHLLRHATDIIEVFDSYNLYSDEEEEIYDGPTEET